MSQAEAAAKWNAFVTETTSRLSRLEERVGKLERAPHDKTIQIQVDALEVKFSQLRGWLLKSVADFEVEMGMRSARMPAPEPGLQPAPGAEVQPTTAAEPQLPKAKAKMSPKKVAVISAVVIAIGVAAGAGILFHWFPGIP